MEHTFKKFTKATSEIHGIIFSAHMTWYFPTELAKVAEKNRHAIKKLQSGKLGGRLSALKLCNTCNKNLFLSIFSL